MNIIRYNNSRSAAWPSLDRFSVRDLMDRAFEQAGAGFGSGGEWAPALDLSEDNDALTVQVELAGMKKEDIDISLENDVLTISGERKSENRREGESFRSERRFGAFVRTVTLPAAVKANEVDASYENGVLTVRLPKAEEAKPRKIQVNLN